MKFKPLHDRVVVKRLEEELKTKGGIIIPDTAAEKPQTGKVVSAGPGGDHFAGLRLLGRRVRDDDPAFSLQLLLEPLDHDAVMQRLEFHGLSLLFLELPPSSTRELRVPTKRACNGGRRGVSRRHTGAASEPAGPLDARTPLRNG